MRGKAILWTLLLALALTACGRGVSPEKLLPELEAPEQYGREEPRRILPAEELAYINREENSNGFVLAEREESGTFFLEFTRPEIPDFSLRISQDLTEAVVEYQGRVMTLGRVETPNGAFYDWYVSAGYGGAVSGYSMPFLTDLTGDGQPELAWLRGGGGTDVYKNICTVYNISGEGEIIPLVEPWEEMASSITVEPEGYEDGCVRSLVTDSKGETYTAWFWVSEEDWQDCDYWPGESSHTYLRIDQERGILEAEMGFGLEAPHVFGQCMGELQTELSYDAERGAIVRSGPITVSVDERPEA